MMNAQVNQEAKRIEECCNKIEAASSADTVRQEVQRIKDCCNKIEQNL
jgi:hypothetical protein